MSIFTWFGRVWAVGWAVGVRECLSLCDPVALGWGDKKPYLETFVVAATWAGLSLVAKFFPFGVSLVA